MDRADILQLSRRRDGISCFFADHALIMQSAMVAIFRDRRLICFLRTLMGNRRYR